jgi:hypothetical protein
MHGDEGSGWPPKHAQTATISRAGSGVIFPRRSNDVALVVLKGHLLLEESVNRVLAALLRKPEAIDGANLRFHQKLCLIRALAMEGARRLDPEGPEGPGSVSRMVDAAEKLNTVRNRLAHHLDYPQIEAQVRDFLALFEEPEDPDDPDTRAVPLIRRLRQAILFICAMFEGMSLAMEFERDRKGKRRSLFGFPAPAVP